MVQPDSGSPRSLIKRPLIVIRIAVSQSTTEPISSKALPGKACKQKAKRNTIMRILIKSQNGRNVNFFLMQDKLFYGDLRDR
jgi:hypothetical protein